MQSFDDAPLFILVTHSGPPRAPVQLEAWRLNANSVHAVSEWRQWCERWPERHSALYRWTLADGLFVLAANGMPGESSLAPSNAQAWLYQGRPQHTHLPALLLVVTDYLDVYAAAILAAAKDAHRARERGVADGAVGIDLAAPAPEAPPLPRLETTQAERAEADPGAFGSVH